jgi:hypothetical protein
MTGLVHKAASLQYPGRLCPSIPILRQPILPPLAPGTAVAKPRAWRFAQLLPEFETLLSKVMTT